MANRKFLVIIMLVLFTVCFNAVSQTVVKAEIADSIYKPGDFIDVRIKVSGSQGMHGLFFYLNYDNSAVQLEGVEEGLMINRVIPEKEFLYAVDDEKVIAGFSLTEPLTETLENGVLAVLRFKVIGSSNASVSYNFNFEKTGMRNIDGNLITDVTWENSRDFFIYDESAGNYIMINNPSDYDVFYDESAALDLTFTASSAYNVVIENTDTGYISSEINAWQGFIQDFEIDLADGYNRIKAELLDENDNEIAEYSITLIKSDEDKFIKIMSPEDHALVNTNMVLVQVKSTFDNAVINGISADDTDEVIDGIYYFNKKIWLKEGFNKIKAESYDSNGSRYEDEIIIYYEKALDIFRFLRPYSGELLKTKRVNNDILLNIIGEISSQYKNETDLNTVTLNVIYYPDNPLLSERVLVDNELADIRESDLTLEDAQAPYMFTNISDIDITGMSGRIDILAYLNKSGINSDEVIVRSIYVNNEKLWIDLIKPHIYSSDLLDTTYKIIGFNEGQIPTTDNIDVYNGTFSLVENTSEIQAVSGDFNYDFIEDMIELSDGTVVALLNYSSSMQIWKKEFGSDEWKRVIETKELYGYTLCESGMGILIGVSNKFNNKSGLYLLKEEDGKRELINIRIGEPIGHVQFIKNIDGTIYLYGNDYLYLYSFFLYSLESGYDEEEEETYYEAADINKIPFDNTLYIKDFVLSNDLKTSVIVTKYGNVTFYQNDPVSGFIPFDEINDELIINDNTFDAVINGEYDKGDYNSYILFKRNENLFVSIMEEKYTNELLINTIDPDSLAEAGIVPQNLIGIGFKENQYYFLSKIDELTYELKKGKIFFNTLYLDTFAGSYSKTYTSSAPIDTNPGSYEMIITNNNTYYQGIGVSVIDEGEESEEYENVCTELFNIMEDEGTVSFKYKNDDIEGLMGFSFQVDPVWLPYEDETSDVEYLNFEFKVCDSSTDEVIFPVEDFETLKGFLETESSFYKINRYYDVEIEKEIISIDFEELQKERYIDFLISLKQAENSSPEVSGLTVYKKVKVKIPRGEEETVLLPVKGFVYDPTVVEAHIMEKTVPIMTDGSFSDNYEIQSVLREKQMSIWCQNKSGEKVYIDFIVQIFDSTNDIAEVSFKDELDNELTIESNILETEEENIFISGMFFGLEGAIAGYELYYYEYDSNDNVVYVPISKGVFEVTTTTGINPLFDTDIENTSGYITGEFVNQKIKTYPGTQQLRLFVENPGGKRKYFQPEGDHIDIFYNLPDDQQEIVIVNQEVEELSDAEKYSYLTVPYDKAIPITVTDMYNIGSNNFKFKKKYLIYGEVKAQENIGDVKLRSYDDDVTFSNGEKEIIITVDGLNRFTAEIEIYIPDEKTEENHIYKIAIIPVAPFLNFLKTGLEIRAFKDFKHACIQPDFYFVEQENWSDEELEKLSKKMEFTFDRPIPDNSTIDLILNFEHEFTGLLVENGDSGIYYVNVDESDDEQVYLDNVKIGTNRLQWAIKYNDRIINYSSNWFNEYTPIMSDKLFDIERADLYNTTIDFPIDENKYYDNTSDEIDDIPIINITKEKATHMIIKLNDYPVWEDNETVTEDSIDIYNEVCENENLNIDTLLREGKNKVTFWIQETAEADDAYTIEREFLYDSQAPIVLLGDYKYEKDNNNDIYYISEFSVIVKEANIREANLIYSESIISDVNCTINMSYLGSDQYKVIFSGLENQYPLVQPSEELGRSLYVRVKDHTDKIGEMEKFYGLESLKAFELDEAKRIDIRYRHYKRGTPPDGLALNDDNGDVFGDDTVEGHLRFYNDKLELIAQKWVHPNSDFRLERSNEVRISNSIEVKSGGILKLNSNGKIVFTVPDAGEKISMEIPDDTLQSTIEFDTETIVPDSRAFYFNHDATGDMLSIAFLFRLEMDDDYTFNDTNTDQQYFRVLTFYYNNPWDINDACLYLAYRFNDAKDQYYFAIVKETEAGIEELPGMQSELFPLDILPHTVLLNFYNTPDDIDANQINFAIDSNPIKTFEYTTDFADERFPTIGELIPAILEVNSTSDFYLFGAGTIYGLTISEDEEVGNFSIAHPFYTAQNISTGEITELMNSVYVDNATPNLPSDDSTRFYDFDTAHDDEGDEDYELQYINYKSSVDGWFDIKENVDYTDYKSDPSGALKGSWIHENYLDKTNSDGYPIFTDSLSPTLQNIICNPSSGSFILEPVDSTKPGRYYFSKNQTNHGLKKDPMGYYSISGRVDDITKSSLENPDPKLCLRINGVQQEFELQEGEFVFVFDGRNVGKPNEVILYIETYDQISINHPLVLTEGNYDSLQMASGNGDYDISYAKTKYSFGNKGTVNLWYKPFQVNRQGYVNYESVIFDSTYIKIYTKIYEEAGRDYAIYMAEIKENGVSNDNFKLKSSIPVQGGWHNIQVSYDIEDDIAYLYIDGNLTAKLEDKNLKEADDTLNQTVFLGSNMNQTVFAEGFIDNVTIKSIYCISLFSDSLGNPMYVEYSEDADTLLDRFLKDNFYITLIDKISYTLESLDGDYRKTIYNANVRNGVGAGFEIHRLMPGSYIFKTKYEAPYRYEDICTFTVDRVPKFVLKEDYPGLIMKGVQTDINFNILYDDSFLIKKEVSKYAGFGIRLTNNNDIEKTYVVLQGYKDHDHNKWYIHDMDDENTENDIVCSGSMIPVVFEDIITDEDDIEFDIRPFYYDEEEEGEFNPLNFVFEDLVVIIDRINGIIPAGVLEVEKGIYEDENEEEYEYKLNISVGSSGTSNNSIYNELSVIYYIYEAGSDNTDDIIVSNEIEFKGNSIIELYYDDFLPYFDEYNCIIKLKYQDKICATEELPINWKEIKNKIQIEEAKVLDIVTFSLLDLDTENDTAQVYLEVYSNNLDETSDIEYEIFIDDQPTVYNNSFSPIDTYTIISLEGIPKGSFILKVKVSSTDDDYDYVKEEELNIVNSVTAPRVVLTNTVESLIGYNCLDFTWIGYHEGQYKEDIQYSYNFDGKGWSAPTSQQRKVEFYNLAQGDHEFLLKAIYREVESQVETVRFYVDVENPVFTPDIIDNVGNVTELIYVIPYYDEDGFLKTVDIVGEEGAVTDQALEALFVNSQEITIGENGSFYVENLEIIYDGDNPFVLSAVDRVGNYSEYTVNVPNYITNIIYPKTNVNIRFSPMSIVGQIVYINKSENKLTNAELDIYVKDPQVELKESDEIDHWKKAKINEDRIFFIENVYVNPGTVSREAYTPLYLAVKTKSGRIYYKDINVWANSIIRPIDMELSAHAVEGQNADREITISCEANVTNIASWSIDYTGDGIYDDVIIVDNPDLGKKCEWKHIYSTLGLANPRVRIITLDGNYFSVSEQLIIHEKIKEASHKMINTPIAMDSIKMEDNSERVYVLAGENEQYTIEVFEVGRNESYISERLYSISLDGFGINNPMKIAVLDKDHIYIASNQNGIGYVYVLKAGEFGNYLPVNDRVFHTDYAIESIAVNVNDLYITSSVLSYIAQVKIEDKLPLPETLEYKYPEVPYDKAILNNLEITKDTYGLLISDYHNQRIIRLTDNCKVVEYFGEFGEGESEFITPSHLDSYENRVFVYDNTRKDIQIFDQNFKPVSRLNYDEGSDDNYMTEDFLDDIGGLSIVARAESNRLFYYALILSKSTGKLAMLRLPQWEELRARVRNNKIIFLNNREVFTAKPSGGDLAKILSSDSIPRIEGTIDYPAISPDGRTIVFTSRVQLYDGTGVDTSGGNPYAYDNLYTVDVNGENLVRIPLDEVNDYEIERPVFNSNGNKIIFSAKPTGGLWQIYIYDRETGGIEKLFESEENARFPYYSPNDRFVVFTTDYDSDEDIEIIDTQNTSVRLVVTKNNARDSFPVWNRVYPYEVEAQDTDNGVDTKIAFVSERDGHKGIYYVYIATNPQAEDDIHIYDIVNHQIIDTDPDTAAIHITLEHDQEENVDNIVEGDYPCFTGDGKALVFEYFNGEKYTLKKCDFELNFEDNNDKRDRLQGTLGFILEDMNLTETARRPSGMKNMITNFTAKNINGDQIELTWDRYTDNDIVYYVEYQEYVDDELNDQFQNKVSSQDYALIKGRKMGQKYIVRVYIVENEEEVATSTWEEVKIPVVAAKPTVWVDEENPYRVYMEAWKPTDETEWVFSWIIDNEEIVSANTSTSYSYEFATSGYKEVVLKVEDKAKAHTSISDAVAVNIVTDIVPVITHTLEYGESTTTLTLTSENSLGNKIKSASTEWIITGPGLEMQKLYSGETVIIDLAKIGITEKVNVTMRISREMITGQPSTDILEKNIIIPLDYPDIKPVITPVVDPDNPRIITFMGDDSIGNIDWKNSDWIVYADSEIMNHIKGGSSFVQEFPENNQEKTYTISLTLPSLQDGTTKTVTQVVMIEPCEIEPVIDSELIIQEVNGGKVSAKLVLSCTKSKGNNIEYSRAVWNVPIAAASGESPVQEGPTAVYSLMNLGEKTFMDVSLTLMRKGGLDATTDTKRIYIDASEMDVVDMVVNITEEQGTSGAVLVFDVLDSKGPDILWDKTKWQFNGQVPITGPVARYDVGASGDDNIIRYVCSLYRQGDETPIVKTGEFNVEARYITPVINSSILDFENNVFELDVLQSAGMNIDWDKTNWYIFDGNASVTTYRGSKIMHAFAIKEDGMGYAVMVEMFLKNDSKPFVGYKSIDVEGKELKPVIKWDKEADRPDEYVVHFSAHDSVGHNINWAQTKWTFGDGSEVQYGAVAVHKYPLSENKNEYKVSMTIYRTVSSGEVESKTVYKNIKLDSDEIKPVITAILVDDGTLMLSAEESDGRGLMLDRSVWLFDGKGDNQSFNIKKSSGEVIRTSDTTTDSKTSSDNTEQITAHGKITNVASGVEAGVTGTIIIPGDQNTDGTSSTVDITSYEDLIDNTESFSSSNMHTGATCRRYVGTYDLATDTFGGVESVWVCLTVYRVTSDGGVIGRQIVREIILKDARRGKTYE